MRLTTYVLNETIIFTLGRIGSTLYKEYWRSCSGTVFPQIHVLFILGFYLNPIRTRGGGGIQPPYDFCPLLNRRHVHKISWLFLTFGCRYPYDFFPRKKIVYTLSQHFWYNQFKNIYLIFFALIKKIFLQTLVRIIFRNNKKYLRRIKGWLNAPPPVLAVPKKERVM